MSCIFNLFKSKKKSAERRASFTMKITSPIPKKYDELIQYEAFLRSHMNRLNRRYEVVGKNLLYVRSQGNTIQIIATMKERQQIEAQFEQMKERLKEVVKCRGEFEGFSTPTTPTLMLEVIKNPLVSR